MAKGKRGPNLFELIQDAEQVGADSLKVPGWWSKAPASNRMRSSAGQTQARGVARLSEAQQPAHLAQPEKVTSVDRAELASDTQSGSALAQESEKSPGFFQIDGPCIRLSFTSTTAAIAVVVLLVGMLACFEFGSRTGYEEGLAVGHKLGRESFSTDAVDEIERARSQPAETELISPLLTSAARTRGVDSVDEVDGETGTPWVRGFTYIVVQEFLPDHASDAVSAREFLRKHDMETEIVDVGSGGVQLIATQGYNHRDPAQKQLADQLLRKIRSAGQAYYAAGGGYRLEGYYKLLKEDSW